VILVTAAAYFAAINLYRPFSSSGLPNSASKAALFRSHQEGNGRRR
jgi:hypothetical protein